MTADGQTPHPDPHTHPLPINSLWPQLAHLGNGNADEQAPLTPNMPESPWEHRGHFVSAASYPFFPPLTLEPPLFPIVLGPGDHGLARSRGGSRGKRTQRACVFSETPGLEMSLPTSLTPNIYLDRGDPGL